MEPGRYFIIQIDHEGRERVFHLGERLLVGRAPECDLLLEGEGISRRHCLLLWQGGQVLLRDLESTNGTFLNGARIQEAPARPGDRIQVGSCVLDLFEAGAGEERRGVRTRLLGRTTIEAMLKEMPSTLPDGTALTRAGLDKGAAEALYRLTEVVNRARDPERLLKDSLEILMNLFGMDLGSLFTAAEKGEPPSAALTLNYSKRPGYPHSTSALARVLDEGISVIAADLMEDPNLGKAPSVATPGTARIMCVPLFTAGRVSGAVYLSSLEAGGPLPEAALQLLAAMAAQIGLALDNLRHLERLERDNLALRSSVEGKNELIGSSPSMEAIRRRIEKVAGTEATVLILGESGTGKELIAQAIHRRSPRRDRPMVCINCGAIPETTVESELFGHERGAFTGAIERKPGKFELASEGTLFLDEIGELSASTQVKLLRVIEERSFYRVGGSKLIEVDVRILAATNADLDEMERQGRFRRDLLFRLNVFSISVPPLRDRPEDLVDLVRFLLDRIPGGRKRRVSEEGMQRLKAYAWPGNARELRNVLEREVILAESDLLEFARVDALYNPQAEIAGAQSSLKEAERAHIVRVLRSVRWNKKRAAEVLGIGRPTLYDRMKQLRIEDETK